MAQGTAGLRYQGATVFREEGKTEANVSQLASNSLCGQRP